MTTLIWNIFFDESGLKYYLIIKPGWSEQSDPISLLYSGAIDINVLVGGELEIVAELGILTQKVADAYQIDVDGDLITLAWDAEYVEIDDYEIGFDFGSYDEDLPLVIEMKLEGVAGGPDDYENIYWSTLYGFTAAQGIEDVAYDSKQNPVILANTNTLEFPIGTGIEDFEDLTGLLNDIMINDFDENRTSIWGAVVGGSSGDYSEELDVNLDNGFIYAVGTTHSDDFYTVDPGGSSYFSGTRTNLENEAFIFRINSTGNSVDWATYVEGIIFLFDIDFNNDNSEFSVVGNTDLDEDSWALEDLGAGAFFEDGTVSSANSYVATFTGDYDLSWGTLFWSSKANCVQYDAINRLTIAGRMFNSQYFETVGDIGETFTAGEDEWGLYFATFDDDKSILWATPYGGDGNEFPTGIATQPSALGVTFVGNALPYTGETDFTWPAETTFGAGSYYRDNYVDIEPTNDGFIVSFDMNRSLTLSTLFGGEEDDQIFEIVSDGGRNWFTGLTSSDNTTTFPYQEYPDYFDDQNNMNDAGGGLGYFPSNAFVSILDGSGNIIYSTYFGGTITTGALDIAYNADIDHIITTGFANFEFGEDAGFLPLEPFLPYGYFQPTNPDAPSASVVNFITEWGIFPVITSIDDPDALNQIKVFPNPSREFITVECIDDCDAYSICDLSGNTIREGNLEFGNNMIQISDLASGLYTISIICGVKNSIYKIVKL